MKNLIIASFLSVLFFITCSTAQSKSSKQDSDNLKLLEQNVESTDSFFNQGENFLSKNELEKALESFSKSNYSEALFYKAIVLNQLGKIDDAKALFEQCAAKNVLKDESNYNLAIIAYDKGDPESAKRIMNEVFVLNPKHTGALYFLGNLKYLENDMTGAIEYYEKALKIEPESTDLWEAVFSVRLQTEEYAKGWEIREKIDKKNIESVLNVLKIAEITENYLEGAAFVPEDLKKDKNISRQIRILLTKGGKFSKAIESAEKDLQNSGQVFVIIDISAVQEGSYVIGLNNESLFLVCSKTPEDLVKISVSDSRFTISGSDKSFDNSEISKFVEDYCRKK